MGLIPVWGRSPEGGTGNPLQYSCLGNPIDRGAWRATVHGVSKSQSQLSTHTQVVESFWPKRAIFKDVVPKSAASGSPGNLSEMPAHRLCPRAVSEWMWQLSGLGVFSEKYSSTENYLSIIAHTYKLRGIWRSHILLLWLKVYQPSRSQLVMTPVLYMPLPWTQYFYSQEFSPGKHVYKFTIYTWIYVNIREREIFTETWSKILIRNNLAEPPL